MLPLRDAHHTHHRSSLTAVPTCVDHRIMSSYESDTDLKSSSSSSSSLLKLTDKNFIEWRITSEAACQERRHWKYVSGTVKSITPPTAPVSDPSSGKGEKSDSSLAIAYAKELSEYVKWKENDDAARGFIILRLDASQLHLVPSGGTAAQTWTAICSAHEKTGMHSALLCVQTIVNKRYADGEKMSEHIGVFRDNNHRLSSLSTPFPSMLLACLLMNSMPPSYAPVLMTLSAMKQDTLTFDYVSVSLLQEDRRRQTDSASEASALYHSKAPTAKVTEPAPFQQRSARGRERETCGYCKKQGHNESKCWEKNGYPPTHPRHKAQANYSTDDNVFLTLSMDQEETDDTAAVAPTVQSTPESTVPTASLHSTGVKSTTELDWLVDSGASLHYCRHREWFDAFEPLTGKFVKVGDGRRLAIVGRGNLRVDVPLPQGGLAAATIRNVQFVPELAVNLLSVSAMAGAGLEVNFKGDRCVIRTKNNQVAGVARKIANKLYSFTVRAKPPQPAHANTAVHTVSSDTLRVWHKRLGHVNTQQLSQLFVNNMIADADAPTIAKAIKATVQSSQPIKFHCDACVLGKSHRAPFPKGTAHRGERPLDIVHADLCGPMSVNSHGGSRYLLLIVDDYSRYTWMQAMKSKDEALRHFITYKAWAETVHHAKGYRIQNLRTDNGGEFTSTAFSNFLKQSGIQRQLTAPYTPQQNAVVERKNRVIIESALTLLQHAKLPKSFWAEATATAVYTRNRCPSHAVTGKTPYEAWTGRKPQVGHLRTFGCLAYAHIPTEKRDKLAARALPCIFTGYAEDHKAYRLFDPVTHKTIVSRDVIFVESERGLDRAAGAGEADTNRSNISMEVSSFPSGTTDTPATTQLQIPVADSGLKAPSNNEEEKQTAETVIAPRLAPQIITAPLPRELKMLTDRLTPGIRDHAPSAVQWPVRSQVGSDTGEYALCLMGQEDVSDDPKTFKEAMSRDDAQLWRAAAQVEYDSLQKAGTYTLVKRPKHRPVLPCGWVLKTKFGPGGIIIKRKARCVAKGYAQTHGIDYHETYAPVARYSSIRYLLALAAQHDWEIHHMDVKSAYLNGDLEEEIYMEQPEGFTVPGKEDYVCRLNKSLYGLKQAGRTWHKRMDIVLHDSGFVSLDSDKCVYVYRQDSQLVIIALFVDDLLLFSNSSDLMSRKKKELTNEFDMEDLGEARYFLGIEISRDRKARTVTISQSTYIESVLQRYGMTNCDPVSIPMPYNVHYLKSTPEEKASEDDVRRYQSAIGAVMYAALSTRPDIAYAVTALSQFSSNPNKTHWEAVKQLMRYLRGTTNYSITYRGDGDLNSQPMLVGYCDANWAEDRNDRRSITGYSFILCGGAVSWQTRKQKTVATSTLEAEYMASAAAAKEAIWWRSIQRGLNYNTTAPTQLFGDSQGAIALAKNPEQHSRTKHIDVQYHFIREQVELQTIAIKYISTHRMVADGLTKALDSTKHKKMTALLGLHGA